MFHIFEPIALILMFFILEYDEYHQQFKKSSKRLWQNSVFYLILLLVQGMLRMQMT